MKLLILNNQILIKLIIEDLRERGIDVSDEEALKNAEILYNESYDEMKVIKNTINKRKKIKITS